MTTSHWDPEQYTRHADHRTRPLHELLGRVPELPAGQPRIADLGCGPGGPSALLLERWPTARITGYDNSAAMLEEAAAHAGSSAAGGTLDFALADIGRWRPDGPHDLILANAALQWVPGHAGRFAEWIDALVPGGVLAFQVPGNFDAPSHLLLREQCRSERWRDRLTRTLRDPAVVLSPERYFAELAGLDCEPDVWETTYLQLLPGEDPVLDWTKGTALRPVLTELAGDPEATEAFLAEYRDRLREAYPPGDHGTLFPFRRIFAVARKRGADAVPGAVPGAVVGVVSGAAAPGITGLDHVQLAAPPGTEPQLRAFYTGPLGMTEIPKPAELPQIGCWFQGGGLQLHLGMEEGYRPPGKAHPGIRVRGLREVAARLARHGAEPAWDDRLPGVRRCYVQDPVGNTLELLEASA
jgi:trans-aconitate 2-methyltransferase